MSRQQQNYRVGRGAQLRLRALALLASLLLCFPALGQEEEAPPAETAGTLSAELDTATDDAIAQGLRQRFRQIDGLEEVTVRVDAGVVTLGGEVLGFEERERAVALAERIEGVASVEDDITVSADVQERLAPAVNQAVERLRTMASYLPLFGVALVILLVFWVLSRLVGRSSALYSRLTRNQFAQELLRQAAQVTVLLIGLLIALEILDATALVGAVLGAAGVAGLALGFAFRDLVENYVSSVLLSIRQPFSPNDHVVINDQEGKVVRLTSRATILMTLDGNHLRIPNAQVFKGIILNYTRNPLRRFSFGVGVGVNEDLARAQEIGVDALVEMPGVLDDPPVQALIEELGDSSVLVRFYGWVDQREASFQKVKGEAIRRVKTVLEDAGMDLPEPTYRVQLRRAGTTPAKSDSKPTAAPRSEPSSAPDITPERHLEEQIDQDRAEEGSGSDLLHQRAPVE